MVQVWRLGLLYKILQNQNIGSKLYNIIKDMHKHTEASVKVGEDLSNFVNIERGVKQGDSVSPIYLRFILMIYQIYLMIAVIQLH